MEKNKHILSAALRQMKTREPGEELWNRIEHELDREHNTPTLLQAIERLPLYEPPQQLWDKIENALDSPKGQALITPLRAMAAAVVLLLSLALWTYKPFADGMEERESAFNYTYSTEEVSNKLLANQWDEDAEAFAEIEKLLQSLPPEAITDEITQLQSELQDLNLAKAELTEALSEYNTDPQFVRQLKEIELERTQLAKELLRKII